MLATRVKALGRSPAGTNQACLEHTAVCLPTHPAGMPVLCVDVRCTKCAHACASAAAKSPQEQDVRASGPQQIARESGPSHSPTRPALAPVHVHSDLPAGARDELRPQRKLHASSAGSSRSPVQSRPALNVYWVCSVGGRAQALRLREQVDGLAPGVRRAGQPRRRGRLGRARNPHAPRAAQG